VSFLMEKHKENRDGDQTQESTDLLQT